MRSLSLPVGLLLAALAASLAFAADPEGLPAPPPAPGGPAGPLSPGLGENTPPTSADDVHELAETFRPLGDATRVRILDALSHGELCVCDLAALVGMSESAVSHQLRLLRNLRLVKNRREGRMVFYALDDRHIITLFRQGLRHVQEGGGDAARRTAR